MVQTPTTHGSADFAALLALKEEIFVVWVDEVRAAVRHAQPLATPVLVDTLPVFYEHLAALVSEGKSTYLHSTLASEHGGERARLTHLDAQAVVHEFQLFREVLFRVWNAHAVVLKSEEMMVINASIDEAIRESVTGFVMIQSAFREQFFSALTHDMRTPLSTAMMALALLRTAPDPARTSELYGVLERQHHVLEQMITDLLNTMLMQSGEATRLHFEQVDVLPLVRSIAADAALSSGRDIAIDGHEVAAVWCVEAIRRAVENLINNAIKYSTPQTPITVGLYEFANRAIVSVANLGPPIPADQIEAIFQLFRRGAVGGEKSRNGWGIGLPYVRSVAERHAGSISVESGESETRFVLDLPLDPEPLLKRAD